MKKSVIVLLSAMVLAACGGQGAKKARQESSENGTETTQIAAANDEKAPMCGAYTDQRPLTEADRKLFDDTTAGLVGVEYTPESVATQVVAGTNYRFICSARTVTKTPETFKAEVVIFQPLPGREEKPSITEINRL